MSDTFRRLLSSAVIDNSAAKFGLLHFQKVAWVPTLQTFPLNKLFRNQIFVWMSIYFSITWCLQYWRNFLTVFISFFVTFSCSLSLLLFCSFSHPRNARYTHSRAVRMPTMFFEYSHGGWTVVKLIIIIAKYNYIQKIRIKFLGNKKKNRRIQFYVG